MGETKKLEKPEKVEKSEKVTKGASTKEPAKKPAAAQSSSARSQDFAKGVANELKKVHWPTRQQVISYTGVVIASVVIVGVVIFLVDEALGLALGQLIK
ncbi:preprotein translocase subunit SecE [Heliobacterium mobile]|uniref:preprotein translocase subunit SecE n=1 Tax=Heliobacterium mobile TaxID=28064 RepID=UPI002E262D93|nr:preprotein translocase subunit SecE [Heliobacterium mobile]